MPTQSFQPLVSGARAVPFVLPSTRGGSRSLDELVARGPLVLAFHRGIY